MACTFPSWDESLLWFLSNQHKQISSNKTLSMNERLAKRPRQIGTSYLDRGPPAYLNSKVTWALYIKNGLLCILSHEWVRIGMVEVGCESLGKWLSRWGTCYRSIKTRVEISSTCNLSPGSWRGDTWLLVNSSEFYAKIKIQIVNHVKHLSTVEEWFLNISLASDPLREAVSQGNTVESDKADLPSSSFGLNVCTWEHTKRCTHHT